MFEVNYLAVILAAVANMVLGALWFSPFLFGKQWMALTGIDAADKEKMEKMKKESGSIYGLTAIGVFIMAYILALFFLWLGVEDAINGAILGIFAWVGFGAVPSFTNALFEKKSKKLWAINEGYPLVAIMVMSIVLVSFK